MEWAEMMSTIPRCGPLKEARAIFHTSSEIENTYRVSFVFVFQLLSCVWLCHPMDCSTPGFPVSHNLWKFVQVHVHWIGDAIQPSHPLSSLYPSAFNFSHHQGLSNESILCIKWPKYWHFSFSTSPSNEYSGLIFFRTDWFDLLVIEEISTVFSNTTVQKHQFFGTQLSL